ncbi:hypothetical protein N7540_006348 [Penicillium herquei]|nr:hypothetical protein N7540_006348 [Penicillium herquei]
MALQINMESGDLLKCGNSEGKLTVKTVSYEHPRYALKSIPVPIAADKTIQDFVQPILGARMEPFVFKNSGCGLFGCRDFMSQLNTDGVVAFNSASERISFMLTST